MSQGVILGEGRVRKRILVPPGTEMRELLGHCLVPGCGAVFYEGQEDIWQRHVGQCARQNLDRIQADLQRGRPAMMKEDFDPEVTQHMRGVGKRMLEEGRLEVKPSERAGF